MDDSPSFSEDTPPRQKVRKVFEAEALGLDLPLRAA
jgi:hypothetical protein